MIITPLTRKINFGNSNTHSSDEIVKSLVDRNFEQHKSEITDRLSINTYDTFKREQSQKISETLNKSAGQKLYNTVIKKTANALFDAGYPVQARAALKAIENNLDKNIIIKQSEYIKDKNTQPTTASADMIAAAIDYILENNTYHKTIELQGENTNSYYYYKDVRSPLLDNISYFTQVADKDDVIYLKLIMNKYEKLRNGYIKAPSFDKLISDCPITRDYCNYETGEIFVALCDAIDKIKPDKTKISSIKNINNGNNITYKDGKNVNLYLAGFGEDKETMWIDTQDEDIVKRIERDLPNLVILPKFGDVKKLQAPLNSNHTLKGFKLIDKKTTSDKRIYEKSEIDWPVIYTYKEDPNTIVSLVHKAFKYTDMGHSDTIPFYAIDKKTYSPNHKLIQHQYDMYDKVCAICPGTVIDKYDEKTGNLIEKKTIFEKYYYEYTDNNLLKCKKIIDDYHHRTTTIFYKPGTEQKEIVQEQEKDKYDRNKTTYYFYKYDNKGRQISDIIYNRDENFINEYIQDPETGRNKDKKFEQKNWQKMRILEEKIQKYFDDPKSKIKIYEINEKLNSKK